MLLQVDGTSLLYTPDLDTALHREADSAQGSKQLGCALVC